MTADHPFGELRVVTPASWLVSDLARGAPANITVVHDFGVDIPDHVLSDPGRVAWWMPGMHARRLNATGVYPNVRTPGPYSLLNLPPHILRRGVTVTTVAGTAGRSGPVFAKLADMKVPSVPAQVHVDGDSFHTAANQAGIPDEAAVILSDPVEYDWETRVFITGGTVTAASVYLLGGTTWDGFDPSDLPPTGEAERFAADVATIADLSPNDFPDGWVVDVGKVDGKWSVVETNPAWSSNPYWATEDRPDGVVSAILAAQSGFRGHAWDGSDDPRVARPLPVHHQFV